MHSTTGVEHERISNHPRPHSRRQPAYGQRRGHLPSRPLPRHLDRQDLAGGRLPDPRIPLPPLRPRVLAGSELVHALLIALLAAHPHILNFDKLLTGTDKMIAI